MGFRQRIVLTVVALFAAIALQFGAPEARAQEELDWKEISQFEIRVNILMKTDLELQNVQEATHANSVLMQSADLFVPPARRAGFISLEKVHRAYFRVGRRDAAKSEKGLRQWIAGAFEDASPNIERTKALRPRNGLGRVAYASMDGWDCIFGAGAYALDVSFSGPDDYYDTLVYIAYCGHARDFEQIVEFLEGAALASQSDNRAAYAARSGARSRITRRAPDDGGEAGRGESDVVQSGSGFVVGADGVVVTNFHVIEGCTTIRAHHQGQPRAVEVTATDEDNDLALLMLAGVDGSPDSGAAAASARATTSWAWASHCAGFWPTKRT